MSSSMNAVLHTYAKQILGESIFQANDMPESLKGVPSSSSLKDLLQSTKEFVLEGLDSKQQPNHYGGGGVVILSTLIVNLAALIGVILLVPSVIQRAQKKKQKQQQHTNRQSSSDDIKFLSFGVGALMATSMVILAPEAPRIIASSALLSDEGEGEGNHGEPHHWQGQENQQEYETIVAAKFGCAVLSGFLLPMILGALISIEETKETSQQVKEDDEETTLEPHGCLEENHHDHPNKKSSRSSSTHVIDKIVTSILIGYTLYNFCNGFFHMGGTALSICSQMIAFFIMAVVLVYGLAQHDISDVLHLLTQLNTGRSLAGLVVTLGGIAFLASDDTQQIAVGIGLSFASGVYVQSAVLCSSWLKRFWGALFELDFL